MCDFAWNNSDGEVNFVPENRSLSTECPTYGLSYIRRTFEIDASHDSPPPFPLPSIGTAI